MCKYANSVIWLKNNSFQNRHLNNWIKPSLKCLVHFDDMLNLKVLFRAECGYTFLSVNKSENTIYYYSNTNTNTNTILFVCKNCYMNQAMNDIKYKLWWLLVLLKWRFLAQNMINH